MQLVFCTVFVMLLVLVFFCARSEEFLVWSRSFSPRARTIRNLYQAPRARTIRNLYQAPRQQGFPLGPAVGNPYRTGVVRGSAIAPLQLQYRQIFTPRPQGMVSGQIQRQQHLAPGGLGLTGWYGRP